MKRTLALAAVALLAAAPIAHAIAADETAPAPAAAPAATAPAAATTDVTLADGSKVVVDAEGMAWTVDATTGAKAAKADGEYKLTDGSTLKIEGGKAVSGMPAAPAAK